MEKTSERAPSDDDLPELEFSGGEEDGSSANLIGKKKKQVKFAV